MMTRSEKLTASHDLRLLISGLALSLLLIGAGAEEVVPVHEYACDQQQPLSGRQLVLQFDSPDSVSWLMQKNSRATILGMVVQNTYNELAFQSCDVPNFRGLSTVSIPKLKEDSSDHYQYYQDSYFLILQLEGNCRNCTENMPLFDVPKPIITPSKFVNGTNLTSTIPSNNGNATIPPSSSFGGASVSVARSGNTVTTRQERRGDYCICPTPTNDNNTSSSLPELTMRNFLTSLNENLVLELMPSSSLNLTLSITNLIELQEVSCSSTIKNFTSFAYLDVELVDNKPPSTREISALEASFVDAYNRLSFGTCDPYFRTVVEAKLDITVDSYDAQHASRHRRRLQELEKYNMSLWGNESSTWGSNSSTSNATNYTVVEEEQEEPRRQEVGNAVFKIQGECRNCPVTTTGSFTLFDDAFRRRRNRRGRRLRMMDTTDVLPMINSLHPLTGAPFRELHRHLQATSLATSSCVCPGQTTSTAEEEADDQEPSVDEDNNIDNADGHVEEDYVHVDFNGNVINSVDDGSSHWDSTSPGPPSNEVTHEDFLASYNMELEQLQEEGTVETVQTASDLEEGQNVECSSQRRMFATEVFSDLQVDLDTISREEVHTLERAFLGTYNKLGFRTCDGLFRTVEDVELRIAPVNGHPDGGRRLRDVLNERSLTTNSNSSFGFPNSSYGFGNSTNSTNSTSSTGSDTNEPPKAEGVTRDLVPTLFAVTGECRNCPVSVTGTYTLFDDSFRRRKLQSTAFGNNAVPFWLSTAVGDWRLPSGHVFDQNDDDGYCTCLAGTDPEIGESPTTESFGAVLTKEVKQLDNKGEIDSVVGEVGNLLEGTQVNCDGEMKDFTSYVYTDLGIEASQVTDRAKQRMEQAFLDTYNDLSFQVCDEFFRVVSKVGLVLNEELAGADGRRGLITTQGTTGDNNGTLVYAPQPNTAYFEVTGRCRNCPVSTSGGFSLFDDSFRRRRKLQRRARDRLPFLNSRRRMQEALDVCLCPQGKDPGDEPPPSTDEFLVEFNTNVKKAQEEEEKEALQQETGDSTTSENVPSNNSSAPETVVPVILFQEVEIQNDPTPTPNATSAPTALPTTATPTMVASTIETTTTSRPTASLTSNATASPTSPLAINETDVLPRTTAQPESQPPTSHPTTNATEAPTQMPTFRPTPRQATTPPTPARPTRNPTPQPTRIPTPSPTADPTPQPTPEPTLQPSSFPSGLPSSIPSLEPSSQPTGQEATLQPTPKPTPDPTDSPSLVPSVYPSASTKPSTQPSQSPTVCNEVFQDMQESVTVTLSGSGADQLNNTYLTDAFMAASGQAESSMSCAPSVLGTTVQSMSTQRLRRRLQQTSTVTVVYSVTAKQVNQGDIHQPQYQQLFATAFRNIVANDGFILQGVGTMIPSASPSANPSDSPSDLPSLAPSNTPSLWPSSNPTFSSGVPSLTPSSLPSDSSLPPSFSLQPSASPSDVPTPEPSSKPSFRPSQEPSGTPSAEPSHTPTSTPSASPSLQPSTKPSNSQSPSAAPTQWASDTPTRTPSSSSAASDNPSIQPSTSSLPSDRPSVFPSSQPSLHPSEVHSEIPSAAPSQLPSTVPSEIPSINPSTEPSSTPSSLPSYHPSATLSSIPSSLPSEPPSSVPSLQPSSKPTVSVAPSNVPSNAPSVSAEPSSVPSVSMQPSDAPTIAPSVSNAPSIGPSLSTHPSSTPSDTPSVSARPSMQPSIVPSEVPSSVPSISSHPSSTPSGSPSVSIEPSSQPSVAPSGEPSSLPSVEPSSLPTTSSQPSKTPTSAPSISVSPTTSKQPSGAPSSSPSRSQSPTSQPSSAPSQRPSSMPSAEPSFAPSISVQPSSTPSDAPTVSLEPSSSPSSSANPSSAPSDSPSISTQPSSQPSSEPSKEPSSTPSAEPSATPSLSSEPSSAPSSAPSISAMPSSLPSVAPSDVPSRSPSASPSSQPSSTPSDVPSLMPSMAPSLLPSVEPSDVPSRSPSVSPSAQPSSTPSDTPSLTASVVPSLTPSDVPSSLPSNAPSDLPSRTPSAFPSAQPSSTPSGIPSLSPSDVPSLAPSDIPSRLPSTTPSATPSSLPSSTPSAAPSASPTTPVIDDKTELETAIGNWISSGGTDTTYGPTINDWDVSRVSDFSSLFSGRATFNDPINGWQTSQVTNMQGMFNGATVFNQPLNNWVTSSVTSIRSMFINAQAFNQNINSWNVGSVHDMESVFRFAYTFNQPLGNWDVSKVTSFHSMFREQNVFNQDISSWNVGSATSFVALFYQTALNQNLCAWGDHLSATADVSHMFQAASCPSGSSPNLASSPISPLCYTC